MEECGFRLYALDSGIPILLLNDFYLFFLVFFIFIMVADSIDSMMMSIIFLMLLFGFKFS